MSTAPVKSNPIPIDRGWAWMIVLGVFLNAFFLIGMVKCFGLIFAELKPLFNESSSLTAVASTMTFILVPILSPITTAMGRRYGTRPVVMIGGSIVALAYVLTGFAQSMTHVLITFGIVYGIGSSMSYAPSLVLVGQYFNKRRSLAMGIATSGSSVGGMVLPVLIRYVFDTYSYQGAFLIMGACLAHILVGASLFRPMEFYTSRGKYWACNLSCCDHEKDNLKLTDEVSLKTKPSQEEVTYELTETGSVVDIQLRGKGVNADNVEEEERNLTLDKFESQANNEVDTDSKDRHKLVTDPVKSTEDYESDEHNSEEDSLSSQPVLKQCMWCFNRTFGCNENSKEIPFFNLALLKRPMYILALISCICGYLSYPVPFVFLPTHAQELGIEPRDAAFLISIIAISELVARFVMTPLADLNKIEKYHFMAASLTISGINLLLMPLSRTYGALAAQCAILGFFSGAGFITMMPIVLVDFVGLENLSSSFGLTLAFSTLPTGGSPALMGYFRDIMGSYNIAFYFCGAITLFGGVILWLKPLVQRLEDRLNASKTIERTRSTVLEVE